MLISHLPTDQKSFAWPAFQLDNAG